MRPSGLVALSLLSCAHGASVAKRRDNTVGVTPHDSYSSSVGVLGCKINTDRVAYWPGSVDCDNICVSVTFDGRSVNLLRVDQSQGAHDISYDAWNYLYTGYSATSKPTAGGAVDMQYENGDASECEDLIHTKGGSLPLSAANSMNYLASCLEQPDSWVAKNHVLYNILDPLCLNGVDETCALDWPTANQAKCPHTLGDPVQLKNTPVYNIMYPSGERVKAGQPPPVPSGGVVSGGDGESAGTVAPGPSVTVLGMLLGVLFLASCR